MTSSDEALYLWKALLISLYCKIQKCGRRILKVFVLVEHIWSLTSTPRFNRATTACPVFPVCVCSYHCGVFPRWKLRTRLFVQYLWLQPMRAICALHVSSLSAEHMYYSYDKCKMHLLCICRLCIQHMLTFLSRKSQIEMWEPNIWQNSCVSWVYKQLNPDVMATFFCL